MDFKFFRGGKSKTNRPPEDVPRFLNIPIPLEPMRQNRYLIKFPDEFEIDECLIKSTSRPTAHINNLGLINWEDIEFKFYDPITPSIQQRLFDIMNRQIGNHEIKIQMLDPVGYVISEWVIYGFIREVNFGDLSYMSDEITEVSMTVCVNHAVLNF